MVMHVFTSKRERRLWFAAAAVLIAIYATLGLAGRLEAYLRDHNLLGLSFALSFALLIVAVIGIGWKQRPRGLEIFVVIGIVCVYVMVLTRAFINPIERTHLFEYGLLAALIYSALLERRRNDRKIFFPAVTALGITFLFGWLDEGIQWLLPNRVYDLRDVGFNVLASLMAIATMMVLGWARQRTRKTIEADASKKIDLEEKIT